MQSASSVWCVLWAGAGNCRPSSKCGETLGEVSQTASLGAVILDRSQHLHQRGAAPEEGPSNTVILFLLAEALGAN